MKKHTSKPETNSFTREYNAAGEIEKLKDSIQLMDYESQGGFTAVISITRLCIHELKRLGKGDDQKTPWIIITALEEVCNRANNVMDNINSEAENHGCHYREESYGHAE